MAPTSTICHTSNINTINTNTLYSTNNSFLSPRLNRQNYQETKSESRSSNKRSSNSKAKGRSLGIGSNTSPNLLSPRLQNCKNRKRIGRRRGKWGWAIWWRLGRRYISCARRWAYWERKQIRPRWPKRWGSFIRKNPQRSNKWTKDTNLWWEGASSWK